MNTQGIGVYFLTPKTTGKFKSLTATDQRSDHTNDTNFLSAMYDFPLCSRWFVHPVFFRIFCIFLVEKADSPGYYNTWLFP
jgi:hypothetical protein